MPELLCFHAQQAVEKSLKAVLAYLNVPVPGTHNIEAIIETLANYVEIPSEIREFDELTLYAVGTRYPGDYEPVSENEYREASAKAEQALSWAINMCKQ
jgi:HEPN domain-containing protein